MASQAYLFNFSPFGDKAFTPQIAAINLDATYQESHNYSAEVPSHVLEDGSAIADNIVLNPFRLSLTGVVSGYTMKRAYFNAREADYIKTIRESLLASFNNKEPFNVVTSSGIYTNMFFTSLSFPHSPETYTKLIIEMELTQIVMVDYLTEFIKDTPPAKKAQKAFKDRGDIITIINPTGEAIQDVTYGIPNRIWNPLGW